MHIRDKDGFFGKASHPGRYLLLVGICVSLQVSYSSFMVPNMACEINFFLVEWTRIEKKILECFTCCQVNYCLGKPVPQGGQDLVFQVKSHYCG